MDRGEPILSSIPELARRYRIGHRIIRKAVRDGRLRAYHLETARPRIFESDFLAWIRSTRIQPTAHATRRVAELLAREQAGP